jgi:hypothetical protein
MNANIFIRANLRAFAVDFCHFNLPHSFAKCNYVSSKIRQHAQTRFEARKARALFKASGLVFELGEQLKVLGQREARREAGAE